LSIQFVEYANRRYIYQASPGTATTAYAAQEMMGIQNVLAFTHEAMALTQRPAFTEIVTIANCGEFI